MSAKGRGHFRCTLRTTHGQMLEERDSLWAAVVEGGVALEQCIFEHCWSSRSGLIVQSSHLSRDETKGSNKVRLRWAFPLANRRSLRASGGRCVETGGKRTFQKVTAGGTERTRVWSQEQRGRDGSRNTEAMKSCVHHDWLDVKDELAGLSRRSRWGSTVTGKCCDEGAHKTPYKSVSEGIPLPSGGFWKALLSRMTPELRPEGWRVSHMKEKVEGRRSLKAKKTVWAGSGDWTQCIRERLDQSYYGPYLWDTFVCGRGSISKIVKNFLESDDLDSHPACHLWTVWPWMNDLTLWCLELITQGWKEHLPHGVAVSSWKKALHAVLASSSSNVCSVGHSTTTCFLLTNLLPGKLPSPLPLPHLPSLTPSAP